MASEKQLDIWNAETIRREPDVDFPAHDRFPYNHGQETVRSVVFQDLLSSRRPLIISGYTSLSMMIEFLAKCHQALVSDSNAFDTVRILIGHEPPPTQRTSFRLKGHALATEVQRYWLEEKGISIFQCAKVIVAIELLRQGKVQARIAEGLRPLHAKLFRGDQAVTLGSSNFSHMGLESQYEANCRFREKESKRFPEACQIADSYWELGTDYTQELIDLLELLLSFVSWKEALSRACAELLEGEWAERYTQHRGYIDETELWPSQKQGIAHALWVIENVGSVLVADATGSGKTKTGAHLIRSVMQRMWSTGKIRREIPVLLCPPNAVEDAWQEESQRCGQNLRTFSHGILSNTTPENKEHVLKLICRAQVLAIDEAHRFLNARSNRTREIFKNIADHVLLFTATPINKGPQDLIAIVELLGADNFDDALLETLSRARQQQRQGKVDTVELEKIQQAIQRFTVRRTKKMLNQMIDSHPEAFRNKHGQTCRYPKHHSQTYECDRATTSSQQDCQIAQEIRQTAEQLKGILNFQKPIQLPKTYGGTREQYLQAQLKNAPALAIYWVMARLRSSRICLLEAIWGTERAKKWGNISHTFKTQTTGDILSKLHKFAGNPAKQKVEFPNLPLWLSDAEQHALACQEEIRLYERIAKLADQMSAEREETKAEHLIQLLNNGHKIVIAFDSNLITLADIHDRIQQRQQCEVLVATGSSQADRDKANRACRLGSEREGVILLCSDAMSEGLNLQQASTVVNLDMPTVVRKAEQRSGRIDRMDSPHSEIEVFFPHDRPEFTLSSDQKFLDRMDFAAKMLGANIPLPEELTTAKLQLSETIQVFDGTITETSSTDLLDVFTPVRSLIEGDTALVEPETYDRVKDSDARVIASVRALQRKSISVVAARRPWVFFAIAGTEWGAPRWVYLDHPHSQPITDLEEVSRQLRSVLEEGVEDLTKERLEQAAEVLQNFLQRLSETEVLLLPRRKQRALAEMRIVLETYREQARIQCDDDRADFIEQLLDLLDPDSEEPVAPGCLAERWLDAIRPTWYNCLRDNPRRQTPLRLKDIRKTLIEQPLETEEIRRAFMEADLDYLKPLDERIVAAIVGVA